MDTKYNFFAQQFNNLMLKLVDRSPKDLGQRWDAIKVRVNTQKFPLENLILSGKDDPFKVSECLLGHFNNVHDVFFFILLIKEEKIKIENISNFIDVVIDEPIAVHVEQVLSATIMSIWCCDQIPRKAVSTMAFIKNSCPAAERYFVQASESSFSESELELSWAKRMRFEDLPKSWQQRICMGVSGFRIVNALCYLHDKYLNNEERSGVVAVFLLQTEASFVFHNRFGMREDARALYNKIKETVGFYIEKYKIQQKMVQEKIVGKNPIKSIFEHRFSNDEIQRFMDANLFMSVRCLPGAGPMVEQQRIFRLWDLVGSEIWGNNLFNNEFGQGGGESEEEKKKREEEEEKKRREESRKKREGNRPRGGMPLPGRANVETRLSHKNKENLNFHYSESGKKGLKAKVSEIRVRQMGMKLEIINQNCRKQKDDSKGVKGKVKLIKLQSEPSKNNKADHFLYDSVVSEGIVNLAPQINYFNNGGGETDLGIPDEEGEIVG